MVFGMLGQRRGTPRWEDDPVVVVTEAGKKQLWGRRGIVQKEDRAGQVK